MNGSAIALNISTARLSAEDNHSLADIQHHGATLSVIIVFIQQ